MMKKVATRAREIRASGGDPSYQADNCIQVSRSTITLTPDVGSHDSSRRYFAIVQLVSRRSSCTTSVHHATFRFRTTLWGCPLQPILGFLNTDRTVHTYRSRGNLVCTRLFCSGVLLPLVRVEPPWRARAILSFEILSHVPSSHGHPPSSPRPGSRRRQFLLLNQLRVKHDTCPRRGHPLHVWTDGADRRKGPPSPNRTLSHQHTTDTGSLGL